LNSKNADDAFNEAERLIDLMTKPEGVAEVFYQRGRSLPRPSSYPRQKATLEEALREPARGQTATSL